MGDRFKKEQADMVERELTGALEQRSHWERIDGRRSPYHAAIRAFALPKVRLMTDTIALPKDATLLEVGSGNGFFTVYLDQYLRVTGLDQSMRMLELNPHPKKVQGTALSLPFKDDSFDVVFCANLLHHLPRPFAAVREMVRVSRNFIVIIEPNRDNPLMFLFAASVRIERGAMKFTRRFVLDLLQRAGARPLFSVNHGNVLPNKTPSFLLPILGPLNKTARIGLYSINIAGKRPQPQGSGSLR